MANILNEFFRSKVPYARTVEFYKSQSAKADSVAKKQMKNGSA